MSKNKTMIECWTEFTEAWNEFVLEVCYSLKINKLLYWLLRKFKSLR